VYTLDTNALIYFLKGDPRVVPLLRNILSDPGIPAYVSTVTEAELFSYPSLSEDEIERIEALLSLVTLFPFDSHVARFTGLIRRSCRVKLADSVIAATALLTRSTLLTRNVKDFAKIPSLIVQAI
jgi:predicted nucleic acid-binding protein